MKYLNKIHKATFIDRPNRFVAQVILNDSVQVCHVKNTGRCIELLKPGSIVYLEENSNINRKTKYDLVAKVVKEWLEAGGYIQTLC